MGGSDEDAEIPKRGEILTLRFKIRRRANGGIFLLVNLFRNISDVYFLENVCGLWFAKEANLSGSLASEKGGRNFPEIRPLYTKVDLILLCQFCKHGQILLCAVKYRRILVCLPDKHCAILMCPVKNA